MCFVVYALYTYWLFIFQILFLELISCDSLQTTFVLNHLSTIFFFFWEIRVRFPHTCFELVFGINNLLFFSWWWSISNYLIYKWHDNIGWLHKDIKNYVQIKYFYHKSMQSSTTAPLAGNSRIYILGYVAIITHWNLLKNSNLKLYT